MLTMRESQKRQDLCVFLKAQTRKEGKKNHGVKTDGPEIQRRAEENQLLSRSAGKKGPRKQEPRANFCISTEQKSTEGKSEL